MVKVVTVIVVLLFSCSWAQTERWVYCYHGPNDNADEALSVVYGRDGNIYAAGFVSDSAENDIAVISLTTNGVQRWIYTYNGSGNYLDIAHRIICGPDSNLYLAGSSQGAGTEFDFVVLSLRPDGAERWVYRHDGTAHDWDAAYALVGGLDGNLYVAGTTCDTLTNDDFTVISLTPDGTERWEYTYNGPDDMFEEAVAITCGGDGNLYVAGGGFGGGTEDLVVVSLTPQGHERWVYRYDGPGQSWDRATDIVWGADGNIYVSGWASSTEGGYDFLILSLTPAGSERWVYRYDSPAHGLDQAFELIYAPDGNLYSAGGTWGMETGADLTVISLTPAGGERWVYRYPGPKSDRAHSIVYGTDGNLYTAGTICATDSFDFVVLSLRPDGAERWIYRYNREENSPDEAYDLTWGDDNNLYVAGYCWKRGNGRDFTVVSLNPSLGVIESKLTKPSLQLIVNRFTSRQLTYTVSTPEPTTLKLSLFNPTGELIDSWTATPPRGVSSGTRTLAPLPAGVFILQLADRTGATQERKLVLLK